MAFSPDEERRVAHMEMMIEKLSSQSNSMFNVIVGEKDFRRPGLAERVGNLEETTGRIEDKVDAMESMIVKFKKNWRTIAIAVLIGFLLGALAFGLITWSQFVDSAKEGVKLVK